MEKAVVKTKAEKPTGAGDLLERGAHLDKAEGKLGTLSSRCLLEEEHGGKKSPFHIDVGSAARIPEGVLAVEIVPKQDVDVAPHPVVIVLGGVAFSPAQKERPEGAKLNLGAATPLLDIELN